MDAPAAAHIVDRRIIEGTNSNYRGETSTIELSLLQHPQSSGRAMPEWGRGRNSAIGRPTSEGIFWIVGKWKDWRRRAIEDTTESARRSLLTPLSSPSRWFPSSFCDFAPFLEMISLAAALAWRWRLSWYAGDFFIVISARCLSHYTSHLLYAVAVNVVSKNGNVYSIIIFSQHTEALLPVTLNKPGVSMSRCLYPTPAIFVVVKTPNSDSNFVSRPARLLPAPSGGGRGPPSRPVVQ